MKIYILAFILATYIIFVHGKAEKDDYNRVLEQVPKSFLSVLGLGSKASASEFKIVRPTPPPEENEKLSAVKASQLKSIQQRQGKVVREIPNEEVETLKDDKVRIARCHPAASKVNLRHYTSEPHVALAKEVLESETFVLPQVKRAAFYGNKELKEPMGHVADLAKSAGETVNEPQEFCRNEREMPQRQEDKIRPSKVVHNRFARCDAVNSIVASNLSDIPKPSQELELRPEESFENSESDSDEDIAVQSNPLHALPLQVKHEPLVPGSSLVKRCADVPEVIPKIKEDEAADNMPNRIKRSAPTLPVPMLDLSVEDQLKQLQSSHAKRNIIASNQKPFHSRVARCGAAKDLPKSSKVKRAAVKHVLLKRFAKASKLNDSSKVKRAAAHKKVNSLPNNKTFRKSGKQVQRSPINHQFKSKRAAHNEAKRKHKKRVVRKVKAQQAPAIKSEDKGLMKSISDAWCAYFGC